MLLTDDLWKAIANFIPQPKKAENGGGRPAHPRRLVLEGILWVLVSGSRWKDLPKGLYPSYQTCHRLFQEWQQQGIFEKIFQSLALDKSQQGHSPITAAFIDGTFIPAKKWARSLGGATKAKAVPSWPSVQIQAGL